MANPADLTEVLEWQGNAHLVVHTPQGDVDCGYFQKSTGGDGDSEEAKWGAGGMGRARARGGRPTKANKTASRAYSPSRDGVLYDRLYPFGRHRCTLSDLVLDLDGNVVESTPHPGVLKAMNRGDYDDTSNDQRTFTIEVSTDV
jgi:hypothetical protein